MTELIIHEPLASRIRTLAAQQQRQPEDLLADLVERYAPDSHPQRPEPPIYPEYIPRPAESLTDDDIEIPDDIEDKEDYRRAARALAPKLYEIAREYWQEVGDEEKLALTDAQLDKLFWLIDPYGVPRFKHEKGTIELPHDPLEDFIGLIDTDDTLLSTRVRETMNERYKKLDS